MQKLITIILNDIEYSDTDSNKLLVKNIIKKIDNIEYIWSKVPNLIQKIKHTSGFISLSNSREAIKISFNTKTTSIELNEEFHTIVDSWADKYKINLEYDWEKEIYYFI